MLKNKGSADAADIMKMLAATSRTFYIPISRLPTGLKEATTSAYLCMRAIDEIEDHHDLPREAKAALLGEVSLAIQGLNYDDRDDLAAALGAVLGPYRGLLPEVSLNLAAWANHAPAQIAPRILSDTAAMAERMAHWARVNWRIRDVEDLNAYTYAVAAAVGLLMCDILAWHDGTQMSRSHAIAFGRGLQLTNIARNRREDLERGVDFYPPGWTDVEMRDYARHWLDVTTAYSRTLPNKTSSYFIRIPLSLADATLTALQEGKAKLTRDAVLAIVGH